jgi:glycosyltransferase involved in cell wall biosynthesis
LYRGLSKYFDITIVSLGDVQSTQRITEIADNLKEICVPKSAAHQAFENGYSESVNWTPVTDIVASLGIELTPQYVEALKLAAEGVDAIVACHPYLARLLKSVRPEAPLWFEAQDVEVELKRELLPACDRAEELLSTVRNEERFAWQSAELVYGCTASDVAALREHYGPTAARITVVPNGYDSNDIVYADGDKRRETKKIIGLGTAPVVLFMGSWHGPNLDAAKLVIDYASVISAAIFLVIGSAGLKFKGAPVSDNVKLLGVVGDAEKRIILSATDLAINPMLGGSGSNLKMFDYLASGTPVLSTSFGARGIEVRDKTHFLCCDIDDFVFEISKFLVEQKNHSAMTMRAAELVRQHYSWDAIVENLRSALVEYGILPAEIHKSSSLENIECNHLALAP